MKKFIAALFLALVGCNIEQAHYVDANGSDGCWDGNVSYGEAHRSHTMYCLVRIDFIDSMFVNYCDRRVVGVITENDKQPVNFSINGYASNQTIITTRFSKASYVGSVYEVNDSYCFNKAEKITPKQ